jgi:transcriptional regulator with XRE-family HTH domain
MYGEKIKTIRELRGFSQEHIADKLGIAQNTYSKIERGHTKLSADTLTKVAKLLGISPVDILSNQPALINFEANQGKQNITGTENFLAYERELVQKIIASKDDEIQHLEDIITGLLKDKEIMFEHFKNPITQSAS